MSEELKTIYLQPKCCADEEFGRVWCEHDAPESCPDGNCWTECSVIPEGFASVPIEPTKAMMEAGCAVSEVEGGCVDISDELPAIYRAMITAYQEGK